MGYGEIAAGRARDPAALELRDRAGHAVARGRAGVDHDLWGFVGQAGGLSHRDLAIDQGDVRVGFRGPRAPGSDAAPQEVPIRTGSLHERQVDPERAGTRRRELEPARVLESSVQD